MIPVFPKTRMGRGNPARILTVVTTRTTTQFQIRKRKKEISEKDEAYYAAADAVHILFCGALQIS